MVGDDEEEKPNPKKSGIKCSDLKELNAEFWMIVLIFLCELGAMNPFRNVANDFIVKRFGFGVQDAGEILLILYVQPVFLTPLFGLFADKKGKRLIATIFSIVL